MKSETIGYCAKKCEWCDELYNSYKPLEHKCKADTKTKDLSTDECYKLVTAACKKVHKEIYSEIQRAGKKQQWLLYSRIINTIFQQHYGLTYKEVEKNGEIK